MKAADTNPIVNSGTLEVSTGILGRRRRREQLPPARPGLRRVYFDPDGNVLGGSGRETPGEKYWSNARSWVDVDTSRTMQEVLIEDVPGPKGIGFDITCIIAVQITKPADVAVMGIRGVVDELRAPVRALITRALRDIEQATNSDEKKAKRSTRMAGIRADYEQKLYGRMTEVSSGGLCTWAECEVQSVAVEFDSSTKSHYQALLEQARETDLQAAVARTVRAKTKFDIKRRERWAGHLLPQLQDRTQRAFSALLSDPSPENINAAVRQVEAQEQSQTQAVIAVLAHLISESKNLDPEDDIYQVTMQAVVNGLQGKPFELQRASLPPPRSPEGAIEAAPGFPEDE